MKAIWFLALLLGATSSSAQVYATRPIFDEVAGTVAVGSVTFPGWAFNPPLALAPTSPWQQIATVGKFHAATLAGNAAAIMNAICPAERAAYADLVATPDDLQTGAAFLAPLTDRHVVAMAYFGTYTVVFARMSGAGIPLFTRHYVTKNVGGPPCLTNDLRSNVSFNILVDQVYAAFP